MAESPRSGRRISVVLGVSKAAGTVVVSNIRSSRRGYPTGWPNQSRNGSGYANIVKVLKNLSQ